MQGPTRYENKMLLSTVLITPLLIVHKLIYTAPCIGIETDRRCAQVIADYTP